jgi:hypothetical protein
MAQTELALELLGQGLLADRPCRLCRYLLALALQVRLSYRLRFLVSQPLLELL